MLSTEEQLGKKFLQLEPYLGEAALRLWAAVEAEALGRGGVAAVARVTGLSRTTIYVGLAELKQKTPLALASGRARRPGGGRKPLTEKDPGLLAALDGLVEPFTRGDPQSALRWTSKSTTKLAQALTKAGHPVSQRTVCNLLTAAGYSLQSTRKTREGGQHEDRDAQFQHLNGQVQAALRDRQPVISVDTKKKELVGDFKNAGREWREKGQPVPVRVHDFVDPALGKAAPYGVYDLAANQGWVSIGINHDTAEFAVESIRRWWRQMGQPLYPQATRLLVTADCGGSNGYRVRLWKVALQRFANETNLTIQVCHLPPGTSKWNKIEHRLFSFISQNWRGKPLTSHEVIVQLIAATTNRKGLMVHAELDSDTYPPGTKVTKKEMTQLRLEPAVFHGEWNYTIRPKAHP